MLRAEDYQQLEKFGISENQLNVQIEFFKKGFPELDIVAVATYSCGLMGINDSEVKHFKSLWENELQKGGRTITKFVPASGAATRMFKNLFEFLNKEDNSSCSFIDNINKFAFFEDLNAKCLNLYEKNIDSLVAQQEYKKIVSALLLQDGLNYANLPKGLLLFHKYNDNDIRTPFMEHLEEGALYAMDNDRNINLHFTISPDHREKFMQHWNCVKDNYIKKYAAIFNVSFSVQDESTNTVAVNMDNSIFRDKTGKMNFRPGGHGALIKNLNEIDSDIIFIKNIDNVTTNRYIQDTIDYKSVLGGVVISIQERIFEYLRLLDKDNIEPKEIEDIRQFIEKELFVDLSREGTGNRIDVYRSILNRPIRVCGMVKNLGEPGGGPFVVRASNGRTSLQILESSQISDKDMDKMKSSSHFNPVDLVCAVKNYKGEKFDLSNYVDHNTGFISTKSVDGVEIKALELPGLWNGAMSDWNTIFVEVPVLTFNPVKTVNDLLREEHR